MYTNVRRECIASFIQDHLPGLEPCITAWQQQLACVPETAHNPNGASNRVGNEIEALICLDLTGNLPYDEYVRSLSSDCCRFILRASGLNAEEVIAKAEASTNDYMKTPDDKIKAWAAQHTLRRRKNTPTPPASEVKVQPEVIAPAGYNPTIGLYEQAALEGIAGYIADKEKRQEVYALLAKRAAEDFWEHDMLIAAWRAYLQSGRTQLAALGEPTHVSPEILPNAAVADLIKGSTLVEIKANRAPISNRLMDSAFRQALTYALVDFKDSYGILSIGVYQAYKGHLVSDPLSTILTAASKGETPTLEDLRSELHELLTRTHQLGR